MLTLPIRKASRELQLEPRPTRELSLSACCMTSSHDFILAESAQSWPHKVSSSPFDTLRPSDPILRFVATRVPTHDTEERQPVIYGPCGVMACTLGIFYYLKLIFKVAVRICAGPTVLHFFLFFLLRCTPVVLSAVALTSWVSTSPCSASSLCLRILHAESCKYLFVHGPVNRAESHRVIFLLLFPQPATAALWISHTVEHSLGSS
jgi:hypothetical protein